MRFFTYRRNWWNIDHIKITIFLYVLKNMIVKDFLLEPLLNIAADRIDQKLGKTNQLQKSVMCRLMLWCLLNCFTYCLIYSRKPSICLLTFVYKLADEEGCAVKLCQSTVQNNRNRFQSVPKFLPHNFREFHFNCNSFGTL